MKGLTSICKFEDDQAELLFGLAYLIIARHPMARGEEGFNKKLKLTFFMAVLQICICIHDGCLI